jgi:hypothetical protein
MRQEITNYLIEVEKGLIKTIPFVIFSAILTTVKYVVADHNHTWPQIILGYIISMSCGYLFGLATNSFLFCAFGTLVGRDIINYIVVKFNKKNIEKTMNKIGDKFNPLS